ncbi:MAG: hypothetical protein H7X79_01560 [Sporomusaceae bacterium]|nr:hypothetical protein [Sporomusaceae bacterium]
MSYLKSIVAYLQSLDICTAALLPTVVALLVAEELEPIEQEVLGNFLVDVGDTLNTVSFLIEAKKSKDEEDVKDEKSDKQTNESQSLKDNQEKMQKQIEELQSQNQELQKVMQELLKEFKSINIE